MNNDNFFRVVIFVTSITDTTIFFIYFEDCLIGIRLFLTTYRNGKIIYLCSCRVDIENRLQHNILLVSALRTGYHVSFFIKSILSHTHSLSLSHTHIYIYNYKFYL